MSAKPEETYIPLSALPDALKDNPISKVIAIGDRFRKGDYLFKVVFLNDAKGRIALDLEGVFGR